MYLDTRHFLSFGQKNFIGLALLKATISSPTSSCLGFQPGDECYTHLSSVLPGIYKNILYLENFILLPIPSVPQLCFALLYYVIMKAFAFVDLKCPCWRNTAIFHSSLFHVSPKHKYANSSALPAWVLGTHLLKKKHHISPEVPVKQAEVQARIQWDLPPNFSIFLPHFL